MPGQSSTIRSTAGPRSSLQPGRTIGGVRSRLAALGPPSLVKVTPVDLSHVNKALRNIVCQRVLLDVDPTTDKHFPLVADHTPLPLTGSENFPAWESHLSGGNLHVTAHWSRRQTGQAQTIYPIDAMYSGQSMPRAVWEREIEPVINDSFTTGKDAIFHCFGPTGAGKTTFMTDTLNRFANKMLEKEDDFEYRLSIIEVTGEQNGPNVHTEACRDHIGSMLFRGKTASALPPPFDPVRLLDIKIRRPGTTGCDAFGKFKTVTGRDMVKYYTAFAEARSKRATISNMQSSRGQVVVQIKMRSRLLSPDRVDFSILLIDTPGAEPQKNIMDLPVANEGDYDRTKWINAVVREIPEQLYPAVISGMPPQKLISQCKKLGSLAALLYPYLAKQAKIRQLVFLSPSPATRFVVRSINSLEACGVKGKQVTAVQADERSAVKLKRRASAILGGGALDNTKVIADLHQQVSDLQSQLVQARAAADGWQQHDLDRSIEREQQAAEITRLRDALEGCEKEKTSMQNDLATLGARYYQAVNTIAKLEQDKTAREAEAAILIKQNGRLEMVERMYRDTKAMPHMACRGDDAGEMRAFLDNLC